MSTIKPGPAIHMVQFKTGDGDGEERREVRVMTVCEGYAMVRCRGAMPYVCPVKELEQSQWKPRFHRGDRVIWKDRPQRVRVVYRIPGHQGEQYGTHFEDRPLEGTASFFECDLLIAP